MSFLHLPVHTLDEKIVAILADIEEKVNTTVKGYVCKTKRTSPMVFRRLMERGLTPVRSFAMVLVGLFNPRGHRWLL